MQVYLNINSSVSELNLSEEKIELNEAIEKLSVIFTKNPEIPGVMVTKNGGFEMFISKIRFLDLMSKQYSFELFAKRNVSFMLAEEYLEEYLIIESNIGITEASELASEKKWQYKPILVKFPSNNYKILDFNELLSANNYIHRLTLNLLQKANLSIQIQKKELEVKSELLEMQNQRFQASVEYAKTIQDAILPDESLINNFFECFIYYLPRDIISGDFYWFSPKKVGKEKEKLFFAVADCTGHGVPAALITMIGGKILDEIIYLRKEYHPDRILEILNQELIETLKQYQSHNNDGMDLALCRFERGGNDTTILTFAGAKMDLFLSTDDKELEILKGVRKTLGGRSAAKSELSFEDTKRILKKNDVIYLATDGFADQCNDLRKNYTKKRFINFLNTIKTKKMSEQKILIQQELNNHMQNSDQRDDITIVGLRIQK